MSIRVAWTNSILHTTARIFQKKQELKTVHGVRALFIVLALMAAELYLAVISLPLYFVATKTTINNEAVKQYQVRRVMTLSVLSIILIIWLIKLTIILFLVFSYNPGEEFQVKESANQVNISPTITTSIPKALVDNKLPIPKILAVNGIRGGVEVQGVARANEEVVALFTKEPAAVETMAGKPVSQSPPLLYAGKADAKGYFTIVEDNNVFYLPSADYAVSVIAYDPLVNVKSLPSAGVKMSVQEHPVRRVLIFADEALNILAIAFILIGLTVTVLTI